ALKYSISTAALAVLMRARFLCALDSHRASAEFGHMLSLRYCIDKLAHEWHMANSAT
ncbi:hypothetical protein BGZ49_005704, partial [Haplosporangium sp. Z 27]